MSVALATIPQQLTPDEYPQAKPPSLAYANHFFHISQKREVTLTLCGVAMMKKGVLVYDRYVQTAT